MVHSLNSFSSFLSITVLHFTKNNRKEVRTIGKLEGIEDNTQRERKKQREPVIKRERKTHSERMKRDREENKVKKVYNQQRIKKEDVEIK